MSKPFNNKTKFDPGRFRYTITRLKQVAEINDYGNSPASTAINASEKAVKLQMSSYDQYAIQAGATVLNGDVYFIVRKSSFVYTKDMIIVCENISYKLHSVIELDQPVHYIKLLGICQS